MLQANKADIIYSFHKSATDLQKLELDSLVGGLDKLSSISGLLAGFSFYALIHKPATSGGSPLEILLLLSLSISSGCFLLCLVISSCLVMWGPGLALRGPGGTADVFRAVQSMERGLDWAFILFCFGLGFYILVCVFRVLVAVPLFPIGLVTSLIMIFAASRIWSIGEDIVDRLVPHNLTSAILKGDPAPIPRRPEFPQFHRHLNQTEYNLICRPEAFPGSGILKALDTEDSTDSSAPDGDFSDHGKETSFGLGHSALGFGQSLFGLGHLDTLFSPSDGSGDRWETLPQDRSHPREESQDSLPTRGDLGSFEVEKRDRMRRPTIPIRQSQFIRTVSEAESKSSAPEDLINNESSQFLPDPELPEPRPPTRRTRGFRHLPSRVGRSSAGVRSSLNQGR